MKFFFSLPHFVKSTIMSSEITICCRQRNIFRSFVLHSLTWEMILHGVRTQSGQFLPKSFVKLMNWFIEFISVGEYVSDTRVITIKIEMFNILHQNHGTFWQNSFFCGKKRPNNWSSHWIRKLQHRCVKKFSLTTFSTTKNPGSMSLSLIICFKSCLCSFFHNFCVWIEVYLDDSKQIISKKKPILIRRSTLRPCNESFKNTVS